MHEHEEGPVDSAGEVISKSERKRRMNALQQLGETLVGLSERQLSGIPISDEGLLQAIREARGIRSNSARRRHLQFIGKLMRDIDPGPIERALEDMDQQRRQDREAFHQLEQLRDRLLAEGSEGVERIMLRWPRADRQQLRRLLLQHQRELANNRPPAASRKLFRYLKELQELYD